MHNLILLILFIIVSAAYLDYILIGNAGFLEYIYVCIFEAIIFMVGVNVGAKLVRREIKQ